MLSGERERRRAAPRVPDEVEPIEAVIIGLAQDPRYLHAEAVVLRRPIFRVHLEVLRDRIHALPEHPKQCGVGRLDRQHSTGQEHDGIRGLHRFGPYPSTSPRSPWARVARGPSEDRNKASDLLWVLPPLTCGYSPDRPPYALVSEF